MKLHLNIIGLDCASCANKIESHIKKLNYVSGARIHFERNTLELDVDNINGILPKIQHEVNQIEDGVTVSMKKLTTSSLKGRTINSISNENKIQRIYETFTYEIVGLDCASCAKKVENALIKLPYIHHVTIDFATSRIQIQPTKELDIQEDIQKIINQVEDDVYVKTTTNIEKTNYFSRYKLLIFGVLLFIVAMFVPMTKQINVVVYIISYLLLGYKVLIKAFKNIRYRIMFDENVLMVIATIGAFLIGEYIEAIAVMLFYSIGEIFQSFAVNKTRNAISLLLNLKSDHANVFIDGNIKMVDVNKVSVGEVVVVKVGEKIPLDGKIINGQTTLDTSSLTGESIPRYYKEGDDVLAGTINLSSVIYLSVTNTYDNSSVAKIIALMESAASKKARIEQFITRFAKVYTPIVVSLALFVVIFPVYILQLGNFQEWLYRALTFLVVSCPCALVVSIPLGAYAGLGKASALGILVKGGNYLELLKDVDTLVFDKTGTLTKGVFEVQEISDNKILEIAAYGEYFSNHPIARSIVKYYNQPIDTSRITNFTEIAGKGVIVTIDDVEYHLGNSEYFKEKGMITPVSNKVATYVYIGDGKNCLGYIAVGDVIKENVPNALKELKSHFIKETIMLTGDNNDVAKKVANECNIDKVYSQLLPQDKVAKVQELINNGRIVAFVGDGINDAPVLSLSHVAIAMGGVGSDVAIEAADIVLMSDDISDINKAMLLSKKTTSILMQNIVFSLSIKLIILILTTFGYTNLMMGVFADVGVTLLAVFNSMRVLR